MANTNHPQDQQSSSNPENKGKVFKKADIANMAETVNVHQFNNNAVRHTKMLGAEAGITKFGLYQVRVEAGKETTQHHNHEESDEFVYILSGTFELCFGDEVIELTAGDFAGFPAHGHAHSMKNVGDTDGVYLMGGSRPDIDICNYPNIDRKMYIVHGEKQYVDGDDLHIIPKK